MDLHVCPLNAFKHAQHWCLPQKLRTECDIMARISFCCKLQACCIMYLMKVDVRCAAGVIHPKSAGTGKHHSRAQ